MGLDHLVDAPFANILIVTGILFLGIAAVGKVIGGWFGTVAPNKSGRIMSGLLGLGLLIGGTYAHFLHDTTPDVPKKSDDETLQDHSGHNGIKSSPVYPHDLNVSGSATAGEYTFKILSARLEEYGHDEATHVKTLLLRLGIRETFNAKYGTGYFMYDGFRLVLADTVLSPKDCTIQNIDHGTSLDGAVTFVLPENSQQVRLRVGYYDGQKTDIPLSVFPK
jgi:hypothetical protein